MCVCLCPSPSHRTRLFFLKKNNNFLLFPPPGALTYLSPFIFCNRFSSPSVLASCWLQAAGRPFWFFRFSILAVCGRFFWLHFPGALAGPCMNVVLFLAAILMRYFQALRNLVENSFFFSFFLSKSLLYIVVMRNNGFSVLLCWN